MVTSHGRGRSSTPVAIIGMACRLPGATDRHAYWRNLLNGVESLARFTNTELLEAGNDPAMVAAPDYVKAAFPVPEADHFDAGFFGYSPHEARLTDPQIRVLLEVAWETFEDAGVVPGRHLGPVGVYAATGSVVTNYLVNALGHHPEARGHTVSVLHLGNDKDFASTRVSFKLDLTGPSLNVQTACSTSMVLVDLARQALDAGECDLALAAASTIRVPLASGYRAVKGSVHSPDGHIRTFDAEAGGTHFASGVAAVLLKPLDKALADGDPIHGVLRGSAVNNDGARKANYAGTNALCQAEAMAAALARADVDPASVGYVECHGTGTVIGDPNEVEAVRMVLGPAGSEGSEGADGPRVLGSVKPNIGHAEHSAGLASLIKATLTLRDGMIPPTINLRRPNPRLDLDGGGFVINTAARPYPTRTAAQPRRALVNTLGIGGTNAAAILEQAPPPPPRATVSRRAAWVFPLSAKSPEALAATAARHRAWLLEHPDVDLGDLCHTLGAGRAHFDVRVAFVVSSIDDLVSRLEGVSVDRPPARTARPDRALGVLFSGQGAQVANMGRALYATEPVFRDALDAAAAALDAHLDRPLASVLFPESEADAALIDQTGYTQPCLFAVEHALAALLDAWGLRPAGVVGHSVGEIAAARVAGVLDLDAAARLVATRGRLMQALPAGGAMAALLAGEADVRDLLAATGRADLAIASVNGPMATVLSGAAHALDAALALAETRGIGFKRLTVSHAFHSPLMDPMLAALRDAARGEDAGDPRLPWISTATGTRLEAAPEPAYWSDQARGVVRYADAVRGLADLGVTDFIELGPGRSLLALGSGAVEGADLAWHATLDVPEDTGRRVLETVAALYRRGYAIDWARVNQGHGARRLSLPTYAFQRERFWADGLPLSAAPGPAGATAGPPSSGSLAGDRLPLPPPDLRFRSFWSVARQPWLADHRVHDAVVLPTTAGLAAALAAARARFGDAPVEIADLSHAEAMILPDDGGGAGAGEREGHLALTVTAQDAGPGGAVRFTLASRPLARHAGPDDGADHGADQWRSHMDGVLRPLETAPDGPNRRRFDADATRRRCGQSVRAERYYAILRGLGLGYGPVFRGIQSLWRGDGEALARVRAPDALPLTLNGVLHPAVLDACLHLYPAVLDGVGDFSTPPPEGTRVALPVALERVRVHPTEARELWVHARRRPGHIPAVSVVDLAVFDREGRDVAAVRGLTLKVLPRALFQAAGADRGGWLYRPSWIACPPATDATPATTPNRWLVLGGDREGLGRALAGALGPAARVIATAEVPRDRDAARTLLETITNGDRDRLGVVHLMGPDSGPVAAVDWATEDPQRAVLGSALAWAQAIGDLRDRIDTPPRLWLVTRGAMPVAPAQAPCDVLQAGLWGLGRSLSLEAPAAWGGLVDLEAGGDPARDAAALAHHLRAGDGEDQVGFRGGARLAARLVRAEPPPVRTPQARPGTYLVTGGLGALGVETAAWIARNRPAPTLVLASRRGAEAANAGAVTARLEALGATVVLARADVADPGDVKALMAELRAMDPPVRGIYHVAGVLRDGMAEGMTWSRFREALAPKLDAAWRLHRESAGLPLEAFVLFSSVLSVIGSAGQTNYTAGNACLDALAVHRRALGLPAQSINWGPWAEAGLAEDLGERGEAIWRARGMTYLPPALGREAFDALFGAPMTQAVVALTDWSLFLRQFQKPPPYYAELATRTPDAVGLADDVATLRARLDGDDRADRRAALTDFLTAQAAATLGMGSPPDPERPLRELGLDSLMAVTLINRVEGATGVRIPAARLIQGPPIAQVIDEVWSDLRGLDAAGNGGGGGDRAPDEAAIAATPRRQPATPHPKPSVGETGAVPARGAWLMPITPRENPRFRLFCFPFAGGGSAAFQTWAPQTDPAIEMFAVEPPGRLSRIHEPPVRDMDTFVASVLADMDGLLDRPYALFGHCLGGLTLYETARALVESGRPQPRHLFCSGTRSPDRVRIAGPFERRLARHLAGLKDYQPLVPPYRQPDAVFSSIIRQFDMAASDEFLDDPELRRLMLPAVRAEFEMTSLYRYRPGRPWDIPITCFVSRGDPYVSREDVLGWGRFTNSRLHVHMREGTHYSVFEDAAFIQRVIAQDLSTPQG
ncbi:type I polyketide synthase [Roseospira visakhapatnamensis]|uniref:Epothilone polyketide synthase C n=1 Tax=Roseospira visakhapatnamensis TaxID=390880 RepID=A0A7W6RE46_9PROT|nr:type I polyketide synthase [Roseospira visakhapatnamensis]MBB4266767.1 epothilone polyketide synthase C [Roseospira visakhapatnamensis]